MFAHVGMRVLENSMCLDPFWLLFLFLLLQQPKPYSIPKCIADACQSFAVLKTGMRQHDVMQRQELLSIPDSLC